MPDRPIPDPKPAPLQGRSAGPESDVAELAALFAAHSGGSFSAEVSADLALEIVLNEIVEQACLATGATGAAIILERDGEMVCRASSGVSAPEFGARLGNERGLTAECIKTQQVQRCEDALTDPRADAEASRSLGVRSVVILPLLRNGGLAGLLEVFSSRARAFGERDEVTLEALAQRILRNLARARETLSMASIIAAGGVQIPAAKPEPPITVNDPEEPPANSAANLNQEDDIGAETLGRSPRTGPDVVTVALGAAVVFCAVLLATLVGLRMNAHRTAGVRGSVPKSASGAPVTDESGAARNGAAQIAGELGADAVSPSASSKTGVSEKKNASAPATAATRASDSLPPKGGLSVYENGKEVFRMPPAVHGDVANAVKGSGSRMQQASAVEPDGVIEVSPEAAEGSLLHRVEPDYPEEARQKQMQGAVVLDVRIGRDGTVQDVKLVNGQQLLADAAIAAVKQWRFKPQVRQGQAVEMQTRVTLYFRMPV